MIQANELRIGNWLLGCNGEYFQMDVYGFTALEDVAQGDCPTAIPITAEILIALGFKPHADRNNKAQLFFLNEFRYSMKWKQITLLRHCNAAGESQREACGHPFLTDRIPIESLHQLQNLYYALTGTELIYKQELV